MSLIDKEQLEARVRAIIGAVGSYKAWAIMDEISRSKAVDAVQVVRCKDCKYAVPAWNGFREEGFKCANEHSPGYETYWWFEPNWYCADGERRESE